MDALHAVRLSLFDCSAVGVRSVSSGVHCWEVRVDSLGSSRECRYIGLAKEQKSETGGLSPVEGSHVWKSTGGGKVRLSKLPRPRLLMFAVQIGGSDVQDLPAWEQGATLCLLLNMDRQLLSVSMNGKLVVKCSVQPGKYRLAAWKQQTEDTFTILPPRSYSG